MTVRDAIDRLDVIHDHLSRAEEYRGFRAAGVALTGVIGFMAAAVQPFIADGAESFVAYWIAVAVLGAAVSAGPSLYAYHAVEDEFDRRRARRLLEQFLPCVLVGAVVTAAFAKSGPEMMPCLPGVWGLVFGLGLISARPFLPSGVGQVGWFYLLAGSFVLVQGLSHREPSGWAVGGMFGVGHLAVAALLARGHKEISNG